MTDSPRRLIAGNWKMNMDRASGRALAAEIADASPFRCSVLICPPAILVGDVQAVAAGTDLMVGGQDCHPETSGAHTGDISPTMLADMGCSHVIVGHSERRQNHGEPSALIREKAKAALAAQLTPIICIGETEDERDTDLTEAVLARQLAESVPHGRRGADIVVAYEPVWAIGTGRTASPEQVAAAHSHVRRCLADLVTQADDVPLLYGGSVKPANAAELLSITNVDGALVGGASLKSGDFLGIVDA